MLSCATECNYKTNKNVHKTRSNMVHHTHSLDFRQKKCKFPRIFQHLLFYGFDILPTNVATISICANAYTANDKSLTYHNFLYPFLHLSWKFQRCFYISDLMNRMQYGIPTNILCLSRYMDIWTTLYSLIYSITTVSSLFFESKSFNV